MKSHYETEKSLYNFSNSMFVFGNVKPIAPTTLARKLDYYIDKSEVKRIAPHGFRHSHATLLINLGCNVRDVADRLGDTVEVVETTYYHILPKQRSITVKALNNFER